MADQPNARVTAESDTGRINTELASRRTGMSFQRTRMSADRTLMSVIRTSLSLIGFGFTIFQVFEKLHEAGIAEEQQRRRAISASRWSLLGIAMLVGRHRLSQRVHVRAAQGARADESATA